MATSLEALCEIFEQNYGGSVPATYGGAQAAWGTDQIVGSGSIAGSTGVDGGSPSGTDAGTTGGTGSSGRGSQSPTIITTSEGTYIIDPGGHVTYEPRQANSGTSDGGTGHGEFKIIHESDGTTYWMVTYPNGKTDIVFMQKVLVSPDQTSTIISAAFGTSGKDVLTSNGAIFGSDGNDKLNGSTGSDLLDGGTGADTTVPATSMPMAIATTTCSPAIAATTSCLRPKATTRSMAAPATT